MTEFYYGQTPASMIYYGKQLIYTSTAPSPEEPGEYETVNLYFRPSRALIDDVIYLEHGVPHEYPQAERVAGKDYYAIKNVDPDLQYEYVHYNSDLEVHYYKTANNGWSYSLSGNIDFDNQKLNHVFYPQVSEEPVTGAIRITNKEGSELTDHSLWYDASGQDDINWDYVLLDKNKIYFEIGPDELEEGYNYTITVWHNGNVVLNEQLEPFSYPGFYVESSMYDADGYLDIVVNVTREIEQTYDTAMLIINPTVVEMQYDDNTRIYVESMEDYQVYEMDIGWYDTDEEKAFGVEVPTGYSYRINTDNGYEPIGYKRAGIDEGWSYDLELEGEEIYIDNTSPKVYLRAKLSDEPKYGCVTINMDDDSRAILAEMSGANSIDYLMSDASGTYFYPTETVPLKYEISYIELDTSEGLMGDNYTYWIDIDGEATQIEADGDYYYPTIRPIFDENGYYECNVTCYKEYIDEPDEPEYDTIPELIAIDVNVPVSLMESGGSTRTISLGEVAEQGVLFTGIFNSTSDHFSDDTITYWEKDENFVYFYPVGDKSLEEAFNYIMTLQDGTDVSVSGSNRYVVAGNHDFKYEPGASGYVMRGYNIDSINTSVNRLYVLEEY